MCLCIFSVFVFRLSSFVFCLRCFNARHQIEIFFSNAIIQSLEIESARHRKCNIKNAISKTQYQSESKKEHYLTMCIYSILFCFVGLMSLCFFSFRFLIYARIVSMFSSVHTFFGHCFDFFAWCAIQRVWTPCKTGKGTSPPATKMQRSSVQRGRG